MIITDLIDNHVRFSMYDVVIIGGGPAGSTAAYYLMNRGIKCLLIDRARFPREKPCGGAITPRTMLEFPYITPFMECENYHGVLHFKEEKTTVETLSETPITYFVQREQFDNELKLLIKNTDVEVREQATLSDIYEDDNKVILTLRDGKKIESKFVLGADGVNSITRKKSGLEKYWNKDTVALIFMNEIRCETSILNQFYSERHSSHLHLCFCDSNGYGWIFPKKSSINIGFGEISSAVSSPQIKKNYSQYLSFLQKSKLLPFDIFLPPPKVWHLQVGGPMPHFSTNRILLLGDSAGFVHPMSGEGIYYAMLSGKIASMCIRLYLQKSLPLISVAKNYESSCKRKFATELRKIALFHRFSKRFLGLYFKLAQYDPKLEELQSDLIHEKYPIETIMRKIMIRSLMGILKGNLLKKERQEHHINLLIRREGIG